jgi:tetratricopeptide (TPR) repeat protein
VATVSDEILALKTQAKNRRDLRRYSKAVEILERAIELAKNNINNEELRSQMAQELVDSYGLLGGVERRWALEPDNEERKEHLEKSIRAYDAAYKYESGDYGVLNSYGMLNRLVSRLLLKPESLFVEGVSEFGKDVEPLSMREKLEESRRNIETQLSRPRRDDYWAAADLALVNVLLEKQDPISAYAGFIQKSPPNYAFKSVLDVVRPFAQLQWKLAETFEALTAYLEQRMPTS